MAEAYGRFRLPDRRPELSEPEQEWVITLRAMFPGGVPAPGRRLTSLLWKTLLDDSRTEEDAQ